MLSYLLGNKGKDLENLFLTSFKLTKSADLRTPYIHRLIFSAIMHTIIFFIVLMIFHQWKIGIGFFLMFFSIIILGPYSFLFHIQMRAMISWMTYACITKRNTSESEAKERISEVIWSLRFLALVEFLLKTKSNDNEQGLWPMLKRMFISMIEAVLDVAENYLLPTVVVEQVSLTDAVPKLIEMKNNIPAVLAGSFGFDMIGDAISAFSFIIYLVVLGIGGGIAYFLGPYMPHGLQFMFSNHQWFLIPIILSVFICSYIGSFIKISASSLKAIYFTIFYVSINRANEIDETYRDNITNYLNFKNSSVVDNIKEGLKKQFPHIEQTAAPVAHTDMSKPLTKVNPVIFEKAKQHVDALKKDGHSDREISELLIKKGWPEDQIKLLLKTS